MKTGSGCESLDETVILLNSLFGKLLEQVVDIRGNPTIIQLR